MTSTHGAWRHAGVRFLLSGVLQPALDHLLLVLNFYFQASALTVPSDFAIDRSTRNCTNRALRRERKVLVSVVQWYNQIVIQEARSLAAAFSFLHGGIIRIHFAPPALCQSARPGLLLATEVTKSVVSMPTHSCLFSLVGRAPAQ